MKNLWLFTIILGLVACKEQASSGEVLTETIDSISCCQPNTGNSRAAQIMAAASSDTTETMATVTSDEAGSSEGMIWIEGGDYLMGGEGKLARQDEFPKHEVSVDGFWIDQHEVTNAQFLKFTEATGYVTIAETKPDWEEMKAQLPPGTPKPHDSILVAGSMIFEPTDGAVNLNDYSQWWGWQTGADWRHPEGPESTY